MTNYAKQQILRMETQAKFPFLIEIHHYIDNGLYNDSDGNYNIYRYANCDEDITFNGNVYTASVFSVTPSERTTKGFSDAKLNISAIDQEWIVKIRETQKRAKIIFIATIQYDKDSTRTVEPIEQFEYILTNATWNESTIQWTMKFDDLMDVNVPMDLITTSICPALA